MENLENSSVPPVYFALTFIFSITLRNFIEYFSTQTATWGGDISWLFYLHCYLFYISIAAAIVLLVRIATKEKVEKILRVILPLFFLLIIAPIVDLIVGQGEGFRMTYLSPGVHSDLLLRFFSIGGSYDQAGITPGQRVEIIIFLLIGFLYFFQKTKKIFASLFYTFFLYAIIFLFALLPFIAHWIFGYLGLKIISISDTLTALVVLAATTFGLALAYIEYKRYFLVILSDARFSRIIYYCSIIAMGAALAARGSGVDISASTLLNLILALFGIFFGILFSIFMNNIADYDIDLISNPDRPLTKKNIEIGLYKKLAILFLFLSLFYTALVNFTVFSLTVLFIGNYFIYSMPPLRLKRITFFSKLTIAINSLAMALLGYFLIKGTLQNFPAILYPLFLVGITATANFIDLKDYEGDKHANIKTLPVLLGQKVAKIAIGTSFLIAYPMFYIFFISYDYRTPWLWTFLLLGAIQYYLINRKQYQDLTVMSFNIVFVWLIIYLLLR